MWRQQPVTATTSNWRGLGHRSGKLRRAEAHFNFLLPSLKNICIFKITFCRYRQVMFQKPAYVYSQNVMGKLRTKPRQTKKISMTKTISDNIKDWLLTKGFPFEMKCARTLLKNGFSIQPSIHYFDKEIQAHREIDICAYKHFMIDDFAFNLTLMI